MIFGTIAVMQVKPFDAVLVFAVNHLAFELEGWRQFAALHRKITGQ